MSPYLPGPADPYFSTLHIVTDSFMGFKTTTDAAGRYHFVDLPPHRYWLSADKQGYWAPAGGECQACMVRIFRGRSVERDLALDQTAKLGVRLVDAATNAPIEGLRVNMLEHEYVGGFRQWTGSGSGRPAGEFDVRPGGEFYLEIVPSDSERIVVRTPHGLATRPFYGRSYYPGVRNVTGATPIVLGPGEHRSLEIRVASQSPTSVRVEIEGPAEGSVIHLALEVRTAAFFPSRLATASAKIRDPIQLEGRAPRITP